MSDNCVWECVFRGFACCVFVEKRVRCCLRRREIVNENEEIDLSAILLAEFENFSMCWFFSFWN